MKFSQLFGLTVASFGFLSSSAAKATIHQCGATPQVIQQNLSFACLGNLQSSGLNEEDNRSWKVGDHISRTLKLGDLSQSFSPQDFTIEELVTTGGGDYYSLTIGDFPLLGVQTLENLIQAVPNLKNLQVSQFPGLKNSDFSSLTLESALLASPELKKTRIKDLNIDDYALSEIPDLQVVKLSALSGWEDQLLADIPYLISIPFVQMPNPLATGATVSRIDALRIKEGRQDRTISGSDQEGFKVPCQGNCDYVELDELENQGKILTSSFEGVRWISGQSQDVAGGHGCLAYVNGGREPTGRHPYGSGFKVVVWDVDISSDTVSTALFFRFTNWCGATPYYIGPIPFITYRRDDFIVSGVDGISSSFSPSVDLKQLDIDSYSPNTIPSPVSSSIPSSSSSQDNKSKKKPNVSPPVNSPVFSPPQNNWNFWTFAQSVPQQSYTASSDYLCSNKGCGFRLGVYSLNSTDSVVQAALSDSEAQGWLRQLNQGIGNQGGNIHKYFPKPTQEQIFEQKLDALARSVSSQIDPMTGQPFQEMRQVQRIAQAYIGGTGSKIDGLIPVGVGGESLLMRSRNLVNIYDSRS